jgi:hypothetical protein
MPLNNDRHDIQEEERRRQEAMLAQTLNRIRQPNAQSNSIPITRAPSQRMHPDNVRDTRSPRRNNGGKRTKRKSNRNKRKSRKNK